MIRYAFPLAAVLGLTACFQGDMARTDAEYAAAPAPAEEFDAIGTEPFWAVQVRTESLTLSRPDHAELKVGASPPERRGGGLVWTSDGMTVSVVPGACSDGMSDRVYAYVALVRVGPEILKGCAYRPGAAPTAGPGS